MHQVHSTLGLVVDEDDTAKLKMASGSTFCGTCFWCMLWCILYRQGRHALAWLVQAQHDRAIPVVLRFISFSQVSFQYFNFNAVSRPFHSCLTSRYRTCMHMMSSQGSFCSVFVDIG